MDIRRRLFQYRSYTPIPFLVVMLIFAYPTMVSLLVGFCIVCVGEFFRLWGVAIAGSETRTTDTVGGTFLITTGPFAHVRNPLYLGNILLYVGVGIMANALMPWLPWIALVYFVAQYSLIVRLEEEYLASAFGDNFNRYCKAVPRFLPRFKGYATGMHEQPELNWRRGIVSEKRTLQAIAVLTLVLVALWQLRG
ncbi:MAG TPA: isoprenylcysteine carboxylmethyltransferase family protein [Bacteroidota bacterium]|jgi:protein-S-isoprenylcysteine O-methyltransferase Ste14|nr:isoprenylcysteine carboxylmethyltransferase family protein [Bacteroidota bacterium]